MLLHHEREVFQKSLTEAYSLLQDVTLEDDEDDELDDVELQLNRNLLLAEESARSEEAARMPKTAAAATTGGSSRGQRSSSRSFFAMDTVDRETKKAEKVEYGVGGNGSTR